MPGGPRHDQLWQMGQAVSAMGANRLAGGFSTGPMAAHPVAVAVDVDHYAACRRRSDMAPAIMGASLKTLPQLAMPRLVVRAMEPFR